MHDVSSLASRAAKQRSRLTTICSASGIIEDIDGAGAQPGARFEIQPGARRRPEA